MSIESETTQKEFERIWIEFVNGDKTAFTSIYNSNVDALFSYGMKLNSNKNFVKDCIQDVFLDIYEHRQQISMPRNAKFYLFKALKRTMFRELKKERKKSSLPEVENLSFFTEYNIETKTINKEVKKHQKELVAKITKELTPKQQEILYLRFTKGFNYIEISEITDINHDSVRKQVYRAIKKLRKTLDLNNMTHISVYSLLVAIN
ncbi:sigma-70 family RNA polymerase sigma factor [Flavivirga amylovorans]|uniref:Sigma-70 family RNA polymerase sigma factor n=1 Tax=Flavivirga amylovorans TaxID=870486 RepID=A0ABT8X6K2_9FLAO|nr:sigma-70 family RNA polymerase sigma factor [Flavivirga amylovorans]MDO5989599.1 sigma-70 family RNA polymerase sigma factor [Flavivirga amylovorans]